MARPTYAVTFRPAHGLHIGPEVRETYPHKAAALARADTLHSRPETASPAIRVNGHKITNVHDLAVEQCTPVRTYARTFR